MLLVRGLWVEPYGLSVQGAHGTLRSDTHLTISTNYLTRLSPPEYRAVVEEQLKGEEIREIEITV